MDQVTHLPRETFDREDLVCRGGTVLNIEGELTKVRIDPEEGCESCGSKGHCGMMLGGENVLTVRSREGIIVGSRVEIGMKPAAIVTASVLLFILPAIALIFGIVLGYWLAEMYRLPQQWIGFGLGFVLFGLSFLLIRLVTIQLEKKGDYEPMITRILQR